jgi:hypothetical protein
VKGGLFSVSLGNALPFGRLFADNTNLWLEVAVDLNRRNGFEPSETYSPRQKLAAVPWAMDADTLDQRHATEFALTTHNHNTAYWRLAGNAGITSGTSFLGTTDNAALDLRVNNVRAFRIEPSAVSPNLIGGWRDNGANPGVVGATIGGGGSGGAGNRVSDNYGTVGGGRANVAGNDAGDTSDTFFATVAGGRNNKASGADATVGGGQNNIASGHHATVAGGYLNIASGWEATVGGGYLNIASGWEATVGGGGGDNLFDPLPNIASGDGATVSGGRWNTASGYEATISGGFKNTASGDRATVAGGYVNSSTATMSTVAGGDGNRASGSYASVGGGCENTASSYSATVGGGYKNTASGRYATVAGGCSNIASGAFATVAGGGGDFLGTPFPNVASGGWATVSGGVRNAASGTQATVSGGSANTAAGTYSYAAGYQANANHRGAFVWSDSQGSAFASTAQDEFSVRATGGARFVSAVSPATVGVQLAPGGNAWAAISDRNVKENFAAVDAQDLLARLATIPVQTWNLKSQDPAIRHIGPMAQDFYAAFNVGEDDKHITTSDADGVALAAIQELYRILQEKVAEIAALKAEKNAHIAAQQQTIADLEKRLAAVESFMAEQMHAPATKTK